MNEFSELRKEALQIVERLGLLSLLNAYGEARIVGSVALDLIVKRDLDIHVLLEAYTPMEVAQELVHELLCIDGIREVRITDYRDDGGGIKVGIDETPGETGIWTTDIWLTDDRNTTAFDSTPLLIERIDDEVREVILKMKRFYYSKGELRNGISTRIYYAVLDKGVTTIEEFEKLVDE